MASICGLGYVLSSEEDRLERRYFVGAGRADIHPTPSTTSENHHHSWCKVDIEHLKESSGCKTDRLRCFKCSLKLQILLLLASVAALSLFAWSSLSCGANPAATGVWLSNRGQNGQLAVDEIFISHPKLSSSPVLEVFQVYQPVLAPSGPTDQTIGSSGSSNTTAIGSADTSASCTQLLMEYSFGFSYGHPFVGIFSCVQKHSQSVLIINRQLYAAIMPVQSSCHEFYCHISRSTIRSTSPDVFRGY
jgi:hypothetical protein